MSLLHVYNMLNNFLLNFRKSHIIVYYHLEKNSTVGPLVANSRDMPPEEWLKNQCISPTVVNFLNMQTITIGGPEVAQQWQNLLTISY